MATREDLIKQVESNIWSQFTEGLPTREEVRQMTGMYLKVALSSSKYSDIANIIDEEQVINEIFNKYWEDQSVKQQTAYFLVDSDSNTPWLPDLEPVTWHYWNQYRQYLEQHEHWSKSVCDSLSQDTYDILSLTADPSTNESYRKQGLVVGNVQSGKTANYLGLICRAADIGYKYIVVLAATTNDLRSQTQQRIEEGLIGFETSAVLKGQTPQRTWVGVGKMAHGSFRHPNPGTTRQEDFKKNKMQTLMQLDPDNVKEPWVFVIKKNVSTLKNLIGWLEGNKLDGASLFLIDDEADNASINTKHSKDEISRINGQIRNLLDLFEQRVYIGYTATPYANILIDKDAVDEKFGKDLFPRNFIFTLSPADSYFGAEKIFDDIEPDDEQCITTPRYIRFITDIEKMPPNGKDYEIPELPKSVLDAIRTFIVASAIRIKDAGFDCHTTMLFNTSPYNIIQKRLKSRVDDYINEVLKPAIATFGKSDAELALANSEEIRELKKCWDVEFSNLGDRWPDVFPYLIQIVAPLRTALVNSKSKDTLGYNEEIQHVIAFGGYRLSRGLTLSGLIVSYFSRNSRAYDTLMQMSRWFGHRPGYEHLCRIWMTEESAGWCRFVADATEDLIDDLIMMQKRGATPLEFGHKIRSHPGTLVVTARNKMGGGELRGDVCLNGRLIETIALPRELDAAANNMQAARDLQSALEEGGYECLVSNGDDGAMEEIGAAGALFKSVPYELIEQFVDAYINCNDSILTKPSSVSKHIGYCLDDGKRYWDVFFAAASRSRHESDKTFRCAGETFFKERRSPGTRTKKNKVYIGNRNKVASKGIDGVGLPLNDRQTAKQEYDTMLEEAAKTGGRSLSLDKLYREKRDKPLLAIHYLDVRFKSEDEYLKAVGAIEGGDKRYGPMKTDSWESSGTNEDLVAWSMSLPQLSRDRNVEYVFNKVALQSMDFGDDDYDEDEGRDDDDR